MMNGMVMGDSTQNQLQVMCPVSFSPTNSRMSASQKDSGRELNGDSGLVFISGFGVGEVGEVVVGSSLPVGAEDVGGEGQSPEADEE